MPAAAAATWNETYNIYQIFESVFGNDPSHNTLRPVLGWQENNPGLYIQQMPWFEHFFTSASSAFYGFGNANYFSATDYSSVNNAIASLQQQETSYAIPNAVTFTTVATYYGVKNVAYEGGPALQVSDTASDEANALAASRDPRMEQIVEQHYLDWFAAGGDVASYFNGPFGIWTAQYGIWSAAELSQYTNPNASPKYRGIVDLANASAVAITAGTEITASGTSAVATATDSLGNGFGSVGTGAQGFFLLRADIAGTYDLKIVNGANAGSLNLYLNDQQVGGPIAVGSSATTDLGNLTLSAGLNTIMISVASGSLSPTSLTLTPDVATSTRQVNLSSSFNRTGIVADGTKFGGGGLDGDGIAFSSNLLGTSLTAGGTTFDFGPAGTSDVVSATGQTIALPAAKTARSSCWRPPSTAASPIRPSP